MQRLGDGFSHIGISSEVHDGRRPVFIKDPRNALQVIGVDDLQRRPGELTNARSFQAVQADRLKAAASECLAGMASDIAGCSRHEDARHALVTLLALNSASK